MKQTEDWSIHTGHCASW